MWLVVAILSAAAVQATAWWVAPVAQPALPSLEQEHVLAQHGPPEGFVLADGPLSVGSDVEVRYERWFYASGGFYLTFLDGSLISRGVLEVTDPVAARHPPQSFHRGQDRADIERLLGELGTLLDRPGAPYPDATVFAYPHSGLVITYAGDQLLTVVSPP